MRDAEILYKAFTKAVKNGMDRYPGDSTLKVFNLLSLGEEYFFKFMDAGRIYNLIFSHDFAKAFYGNQSHDWTNVMFTCRTCGESRDQTGFCWQFHLQQKVLEKNPIKYLEQFLK